jgi:hypothetical protein
MSRVSCESSIGGSPHPPEHIIFQCTIFWTEISTMVLLSICARDGYDHEEEDENEEYENEEYENEEDENEEDENKEDENEEDENEENENENEKENENDENKNETVDRSGGVEKLKCAMTGGRGRIRCSRRHKQRRQDGRNKITINMRRRMARYRIVVYA